MKFYSSIAPYYDLIFPHNPTQVDFVNSSLKNVKNSNLLDVGCGTGNLAIAMAKYAHSVTGIDIDEEMLAIANKKNKSKNLAFKEYGIRSLKEHFANASLDAIICFGNTLVHLNDAAEINSFVETCASLLKKGGKLLLQIINYNYILDEGKRGLPTIENDQIRFIRSYEYSQQDNEICFYTELFHRPTCTIIENEVFLYPIRQMELSEIIRNNNFKVLNSFGGYGKQKLKPDSQQYIIEAEKM